MRNYYEKKKELLDAPDTSYWLRKAMEQLEERDAVDAINDAEVLFDLMQMRFNEMIDRRIIKDPTKNTGKM